MAAEWDARTYHQIAAPHEGWGTGVLDRLPLNGDEVALDAGIGSGRVARQLIERLPNGRLYGVDQQASMLEVAAETLASYGDRVRLIQGDLSTVPLPEPVGVIFSTATFHWIHDHATLFRNLASNMKAGGRLATDCGGHGNTDVLKEVAAEVVDREPYRSAARPIQGAPYYAPAEATADHLAAAGFTEIRTWLAPSPAPFPDAASFAQYLTTIVLRPNIAALPADLRGPYIDDIVGEYERQAMPYVVDYVRLNISAVRG